MNICAWKLACWAFWLYEKSSPVSRMLPLTKRSMKLPGWTPFLISGTCVNFPLSRDFPPFETDNVSPLVTLWEHVFSFPEPSLSPIASCCFSGFSYSTCIWSRLGSSLPASFKSLLFGSAFTTAWWSSSRLWTTLWMNLLPFIYSPCSCENYHLRHTFFGW